MTIECRNVKLTFQKALLTHNDLINVNTPHHTIIIETKKLLPTKIKVDIASIKDIEHLIEILEAFKDIAQTGNTERFV